MEEGCKRGGALRSSRLFLSRGGPTFPRELWCLTGRSGSSLGGVIQKNKPLDSVSTIIRRVPKKRSKTKTSESEAGTRRNESKNWNVKSTNPPPPRWTLPLPFPFCRLIEQAAALCCVTVSWSQLVGRSGWRWSCCCCYCSVRCSLVSPCLEGWLGDGAWEGCVPEGRVWAMGTPPGTMPSNAPGMPPGATPTTLCGYLSMGGVRDQCREHTD